MLLLCLSVASFVLPLHVSSLITAPKFFNASKVPLVSRRESRRGLTYVEDGEYGPEGFLPGLADAIRSMGGCYLRRQAPAIETRESLLIARYFRRERGWD